MKRRNTQILFGIFLLVFAVSCGQQASETTEITTEQLAKGVVVEAACGECMFELPGESCDLAVKINGQAYFVDGAEIDGHGDAHAENGMCTTVRKAEVAGEITDGRFVAKSFNLLPIDDAGHDHSHDHSDDGHTHTH